jgi:hypothetical protein
VANLPLLALLLTPQLMRSRAGSETLLLLGMLLLTGLLAAATVLAPEVDARVNPAAPVWVPGRARSAVRDLYRRRRRTALTRLGELLVGYVAAQAVGGIIVWVMPHAWSNPDFGADPGADRWVIHYPNFAVQAIAIYAVTCLAFAWYGSRLRQLAGQP